MASAPTQHTSTTPLPVRVLFGFTNPDDVGLCRKELKGAGWEVSAAVARTGAEMAECLRADRCDVIVAGYQFPDGAILDLLPRLRHVAKNTPLLLVTDPLGEERAVECMEQGVAACVLKSGIARLPEAMRRVLAGRRWRDAQARAEVALHRAEAGRRSLIENAAQGIGRLSLAEDRLDYANPALAAMLGYPSPIDLYGLSFSRDVAATAGAFPGQASGSIDLEMEWKTKAGPPITVHLTGQRRCQGAVDLVEFVAEDITGRRQADVRIAQRNRMYAVSCQAGQAIKRTRARDELFREVCRILVEVGRFRMAWVGLIDEKRMVRPVAWHGHVDGYLDSARISAGDELHGRGSIGTAARTGEHGICDDVRTDPRLIPWREEMLRREYLSFGAFPICVGGQPVGALTLYADQPRYFDSENVELLDALAADISFALDGMEAERRRQRAEAELERLFHLSLDMLCILGTDGYARRLNPAWEHTLGWPMHEMLGRRVLRFVHPDDRRTAVAEFRRLAEGANATWFDARFRARDGSYRSLMCNATAAPEHGRIYVVARDATDRGQGQGAPGRLAAVVESSEDAIVSTLPDGTVTTWNSGAESVFGYSAHEAIGHPIEVLFPPERSDEVVRVLKRARRGDSLRNYETVHVRKGGRRIHVSFTVSPIRDTRGRVVGLSVISRDITSRKRLETQLRAKNEELERQNREVREATRMKSEFLANMSHELRSPLNGIIGFTELLHDGKLGPVSPDHKEYLGDILSSARHLLQLINDVLDLAKVESGRIEFRAEPVALAKPIREVSDVLRALAAQKRILISHDIPEELNAAVLDPSRFKQILYNYLSNALKFTPEDGRVTVRVRPADNGQFRLEVQDNGIGISPEDLPNLFIEFRQLDTSAAKKYQGSGLGLALTKRIVEAQGGRVGVESTPGGGSLFYAVLPRVASKT